MSGLRGGKTMRKKIGGVLLISLVSSALLCMEKDGPGPLCAKFVRGMPKGTGYRLNVAMPASQSAEGGGFAVVPCHPKYEAALRALFGDLAAAREGQGAAG